MAWLSIISRHDLSTRWRGSFNPTSGPERFLKVLQSHDESAAGDVVEGVSTFLARNGFETERRASDEGLFLLSATASECRLLVAVLSPEGWHRDVIRKLTPSDSQLIFVYNGMIYADQPVMLTRLNVYWARLVRAVGGHPPSYPVLGIVGSPKCALGDIKWIELAL